MGLNVIENAEKSKDSSGAGNNSITARKASRIVYFAFGKFVQWRYNKKWKGNKSPPTHSCHVSF